MNGILTLFAKQVARIFRRRGHGASRKVSHRAGCNLREIIAQTTDQLVLEARNNGIEVVVTVHESVPERFAGSAEGIQRTIKKQIGNALEEVKSGFLRFDVSCVKRPDGRSKLRFRTSMSRKHRPDTGFIRRSDPVLR